MKRSLRSFSYYVPTDLVRTMLESGQEARLEGHTRTMTVYFSDIAGFTTLAETLTPVELVDHMSRYLDEMTRVIVSGGGTIDKFIGDAVMAFWGAPAADENHAAHACEAAVRCQRALAQLRASATAPWLAKVNARIGVATGDVLVGNIGTPARFNYTVMGDTVNLASRLEGLNKQYGTDILVSESAFLAAGSRVVGRPADIVQVKGKQIGVRVFEILGLGEDDDSIVRQIATFSDEAFAAYTSRDFAGAIDRFEQVLNIRPDDRLATMLLLRCREYEASPPPEDWNGIHVVSEK
jgi:adenylate cyclase